MKVSKLLEYSITVRVIVDEEATYDEIIIASRPKVIDVVNNELGDNLIDIEDD